MCSDLSEKFNRQYLQNIVDESRTGNKNQKAVITGKKRSWKYLNYCDNHGNGKEETNEKTVKLTEVDVNRKLYRLWNKGFLAVNP